MYKFLHGLWDTISNEMSSTELFSSLGWDFSPLFLLTVGHSTVQEAKIMYGTDR